MFLLADCNNFYVSCERVFNPKLEGKPVIVLSNNDGCVIARSEEAKALGIRMAEPSFLIKDFLEFHKVNIFSANYALYGDMSERVMQTLRRFVPDMEIYSIDEAFLEIPGMTTKEAPEFSRKLRQTVMRWTGIPISIGMAPTKTLAKLANDLAKKKLSSGGLLMLNDLGEIKSVLKKTLPGDIWGVGEQYGKLLEKNGFGTAWAFSRAPDLWIRKNMTVMGLRTAKELRGESCIPMDMVIPDKKGIMTARSFGKEVGSFDELREAVSTFTARCAEKLRSQKLCASQLMVFLNTNRFKPEEPQYNNFEMLNLDVPTSAVIELTGYAMKALEMIWRKEFRYKKAGVFLSGIVPANQLQASLFDKVDRVKGGDITNAIDEINRQMGRDKVRLAVQGFDRKWRLRQEKLSPNYTTRWEDIPVVDAVE